MTILDQLAKYSRDRTALAKSKFPLADLRREALNLPKGNFDFEKSMRKPDLSFICECKKASPSKGVIAEKFPYVEIAKEYEAAGADAISVLTEPKWFLGSPDYLAEISKSVSLPCLRKDFITDEYMIYEAKFLGASAVLLICSILDGGQLSEYISLSEALGLSALVEVHDESEVRMAADAKAKIIGVNNRNLKDFSVDTKNTKNLKKFIPNNALLISESGIKDAQDALDAKNAGADAVLVGETMMLAADKREKLAELRSAL